MRTGLRILGMTLAAGVIGSACGGSEVPWSDQGPFYVGNESSLRDLLTFNHASADDAACVARELFKDPPVPSTENSNVPYYTFTSADFEAPFVRCGVDADDLWHTRSD